MGRKSRAKQHRRAHPPRPQHADFTVLSPGALEVLSIGKGDLRIEIGDSNADRAKAQQTIEEMLRKGYTLFVETADGPLKVTKFLPDEMVYIVADTPDIGPDPASPDPEPVEEPEAGVAGEQEPAVPKPAHKARTKATTRKVPVRGSKTTAIGRTAGG